MNWRNYSKRTVDSYLFCVKKFLEKTKKHPKFITKKDVKKYLDDLNSWNRSGSTKNVYFNAIKFFIEETLGKRYSFNMRFSRRPKTLPIFLEQEEIKELISVIKNKKHKLMIKLLYSAGLRLNELTNLKVADLELEQGYGWVRQGKGRKDRPFIIAKKIRKELKNQMIDKDNDEWIFTGYGKDHISARSIQEIIKNANTKSSIKKNVHPHTLRHSFATHLAQNGCDAYTIQQLLGHTSSETTRKYVHMALPIALRVESPLDKL